MDKVIHAATRYLKNEHDFIVQSCSEIKGGLTNKLYSLRSSDGRNVILKQYYRDEYQRLRREFDALSYLKAQGFTDIPIPYYKDDKLGYALYSFVKGKTLSFRDEQTQGVTRDYLDQMVAFIVSLHDIEPTSKNRQFPNAVGACFGIDEYMDVTEMNLRKVEALPSNALQKYAQGLFAIPKAVAVIRNRMAIAVKLTGNETTGRLDGLDLRLSPVDFGSHNILVNKGNATFIDFEEFGWDDPMQMVAYATPALAAADRDYLVSKYLANSPLPGHVTRRLPAIIALRELNWISRLLLGLTPAVIQKRQFAVTGFDLDEYVARQCERIGYHLKGVLQDIGP